MIFDFPSERAARIKAAIEKVETMKRYKTLFVYFVVLLWIAVFISTILFSVLLPFKILWS